MTKINDESEADSVDAGLYRESRSKQDKDLKDKSKIWRMMERENIENKRWERLSKDELCILVEMDKLKEEAIEIERYAILDGIVKDEEQSKESLSWKELKGYYGSDSDDDIDDNDNDNDDDFEIEILENHNEDYM